MTLKERCEKAYGEMHRAYPAGTTCKVSDPVDVLLEFVKSEKARTAEELKLWYEFKATQ